MCNNLKITALHLMIWFSAVSLITSYSIWNRGSLRCVHATRHTTKRSFQSIVNAKSKSDASVEEQALQLLDCLTSPKNRDDPLFDQTKDERRNNVIAQNDYSMLKVKLQKKGLQTSGDKTEMIIRLLLNAVDPSIKYSQM